MTVNELVPLVGAEEGRGFEVGMAMEEEEVVFLLALSFIVIVRVGGVFWEDRKFVVACRELRER